MGSGGEPWSQWGGTDRDFMVEDGEGLKPWKGDKPKQLWHRELGDGYSTIVADGDLLYTQYRPGDAETEYVVALRAADGKTVWELETKSPYTDMMKQFGPGPSSTPLVAEDRVFAIGANMVLHCIDKKSGDVKWQKDLVKEFGATVPGRGYCASPLAFKDLLIVPLGAGEGKSIVAFKQGDGTVAWQGMDYQVAHSSPLLVTIEGIRHAVLATKQHMIGFEPDSGKLLWEQELNPEGAYLSSPILVPGNKLFISSAYGGGSHLIQLQKDGDALKADELWYGRKLRIHHANPIYMNGHVYGSSGDFGPAFVTCIDLESGDMKWRERGFSKATLVQSGGQTVLLDEDGQLAIAELSPDGMKTLCTAKVAELYAWAAPTLVDGRLYLRDRKHIMAFDLTGGR